MTEALAYLNGQFLPQSEARLPYYDAGFVLGATVTDFCRTFRQRLFRWSDHLTRFRASCEAARIAQPLTDQELTAIADKVLAHNAAPLPADGELALVVFATPGPVGYYGGLPGGASDGPPTLGLHTFPLVPSRFRRLFEEGARLIVPSVLQVPADCVSPRIKQRSRMHWWLAEQEVHDRDPVASALLLDAAGHVTETAGANLLIVREGKVLTPPRMGVLPGISLLTVEELCADLGVPFAERALTLADCQSADEAMLANTSYCLAGVRTIQGAQVPWPGAIFRRLLAAWEERVGMKLHPVR
jgi:branched-subunit amino acid aminotransferase/4-amino-4-deoxychorismate lyase